MIMNQTITPIKFDGAEKKQERPVWVTVIGVFSLLYSLRFLLIGIVVFFWTGQSTRQLLFTSFIGAGMFISSIGLFFMRKWSMNLYALVVFGSLGIDLFVGSVLRQVPQGPSPSEVIFITLPILVYLNSIRDKFA